MGNDGSRCCSPSGALEYPFSVQAWGDEDGD